MPNRKPVGFHNPNSNHLYFYDITNGGIRVEKDPNRERMEFWNKFYDEHKQLMNTDFNFSFV